MSDTADPAGRMSARSVGAGAGWHVRDLTCTAGPADPAFEECHATVALAVVLSGTFVYRATSGTAFMAPGGVLLGSVGHAFECSHEHGAGDRCLSLHFSPEAWEEVVAGAPGVRRAEFALAALPPAAGLIAVSALFEAAGGGAAMEEAALAFAGTVLRVAADSPAGRTPDPAPRDVRRVAEAVRRIEARAHDLEDASLSLGALARAAGLGPYHFLRTFRRVVGVTPHQYKLRVRMQRAAVRLRTSADPVASVALEAGFGDLSTFNRRFRATVGEAPGAFRRNAAAELAAAAERTP